MKTEERRKMELGKIITEDMYDLLPQHDNLIKHRTLKQNAIANVMLKIIKLCKAWGSH